MDKKEKLNIPSKNGTKKKFDKTNWLKNISTNFKKFFHDKYLLLEEKRNKKRLNKENHKKVKSNKSIKKVKSAIPKKSCKFWKQYKKEINLTMLILAMLFFVVSVCMVMVNLSSVLNVNQSKIMYIDDTPIKYIGIDDGYITEKLIVEAGEVLPAISEYFSPDYPLAEDVTINYYSGNTAIPVESFTYQYGDLLYVRGSNSNITVVITNNEKEYSTNLLIRDSTAPEIQLEEVTITVGDEINPNAFVSLFIDNSRSFEFTAELITEVKNNKAGTYDIELKVCDVSENCTNGKTTLKIVKKQTSSSTGSNSSGNNSTGKKPSSGSSNSSSSSSSNSSSGNSSGGSSSGNSSSGSSGNSENNSSGGSSSSSGASNNSSSGSGGSTLDAAVAREVVGTYEKNNYNLVINHYGTTETTYYEYVKYTLYTDGYVEVLDYKGKGTTVWNFSTFDSTTKENLSLMKRDAISLMVSDSNYYGKLQNTFLTNTNALRTAVGARNLTLDNDLCILAQMRLYELQYGNTIAHERPDGSNWDTLLNVYGYKVGTYNGKTGQGEILTCGQSNNATAFAALENSSGHYNVMVNPLYGKTGVGRFTLNGVSCWLQIFTT